MGGLCLRIRQCRRGDPPGNAVFSLWVYRLAGDGYYTVYNPGRYGPTPWTGKNIIFICPAFPSTNLNVTYKSWKGIGESGGPGCSYGFNDSYTADITTHYKIGGGVIKTRWNTGNGTIEGTTSRLLLLGDSRWGGYSGYNDAQVYRMDRDGSISGVLQDHHPRCSHGRRGNFLFGDGHVESLSPEDFVGDFGGFPADGVWYPGSGLY